MEHITNSQPITPVEFDDDAPALVRIIPFAVFAILCSLVFRASVDDPLITFRYAANVMRGYGPVFNPGDPVEGFTSPLHLIESILLLNIVPSVGMLFKAKIVSALFGLVVIWQTGLLAARFKLFGYQVPVVQLIVAVNMSFVGSSVNGLETSMYCCTLLAATLAFATELDKSRGYLSAVLLSIAVLGRPEGLMAVGCFFVLRVFGTLKQKKSLNWLLVWCLIGGGLLLAFEATRFGIYHQLLPNTYYAKHIGFHPKIGFHYLRRAFGPVDSWIKPAGFEEKLQDFMGILYWLVALLGIPTIVKKPQSAALLAPLISTSVFILLTGEDWMASWRFGVAMIPYLAVLQFFGLGWIASKIVGSSKRSGDLTSPTAPIATALVGAFILAIAFGGIFFSRKSILDLVKSGGIKSTQDSEFFKGQGSFPGMWLATSDFITPNLPKNSTIAYSEMGYAGFHNLGVRFIDIRGLTDKVIAHYPNHYKSANGVNVVSWPTTDNALRRYIFASKPDAIITFDVSASHPPHTIGDYIYWKSIDSSPTPVVYVRADELTQLKAKNR